MENPYLREFRKVDGTLMDCVRERMRLTRKYAWAVPSEEAVQAIASHGPIVEIGAGTGYWAWLLRQVGVDVVAYDIAPHSNHWSDGRYSEVKVGGFEKAAAHLDRALFLCWPPYDDPFADECLAAYEAAGGKTVVYIGEHRDGCTGDDNFHERLQTSWKETCQVEIPQYFTIHDSLWVYVRRD